MSSPHQRCVSCVMDTTDPDISFDEYGVCDHCNSFFSSTLPSWKPNSSLKSLVHRIKSQGKGRDFDCLIGMSGGVDSS